MKKLPFIKSRNFTSHEVARSSQVRDDIDIYLTGYCHGFAQGLRDALSKKFGSKFRGLLITSSNRAAYNHLIKNAASNSHHIFRVDPDGQLHVSLDMKPIGITLDQLYDFLVANYRGEIYLNRAQGIVHAALVAQEDEHWKQ